MTVITRVKSQSGNGTYEVRQGGDGVVYCTCPAWRFQRAQKEQRVCKHMRGAAVKVVAFVNRQAAKRKAA